jgi:hypothetical protein
MPNAVHETSAVAAWPHRAACKFRRGKSVTVVLEKGQCDSHKIEIKTSARTSILISSLTL